MMKYASTIDEVEKILRGIKGIVDLERLSNDDRAEILDLEQKAEQILMMGLAKTVNRGLRDAIDKEVTYAAIHDPDLRHPPGPTVIWVREGETIGEEVWDKAIIEELKEREDVLFIGEGFVLYTDKIRRMQKTEMTVVFPGLAVPELQNMDKIESVVSATLSAPADLHLKRKLGWSTADPKIGTILIGFNLVK